ncbi:MAG: radical SAM protein [Candidatus Omnitrophica bacterium]|nr:radical SAM protein [Candidatus Omnitrophota bacterium]
MSKRAAILTNDIECERHIQYYARIEKYLIANGWEIAADLKRLDKVIVCACGFHDFMYKKVRKILGLLKEAGLREEDIVIAGCLTKTHELELKGDFKGNLIVTHKELELDKIIGAETAFDAIEPDNLFNVFAQADAGGSDRIFYIKIAEGCLGGCSYCVIKKGKGALRSVLPDEIRRQFSLAIEGGHRRIFLMGEDTFAYGIDIGTDIISLAESLLSIEPDVDFYFGNLHNRWLGEYADDIHSLCKKGVIKKLHIGLQHVNEGLLEKMGRLARRSGRPVSPKHIYKIIQGLKKEFPGLYLSADIMVGFPGETDEIFDELVEFFKRDRCFNNISHFGFSDVKAADTFRYKDKIDPLRIAVRWDRLKEVLGERSFYNSTDSPDNYGLAYKMSLENDLFFCKDSFIPVKEKPLRVH